MLNKEAKTRQSSRLPEGKPKGKKKFMREAPALRVANPDDLARGWLYADVATENRQGFLSRRSRSKKNGRDPDHFLEMPTPPLVSTDS